MDVLYKEEIHSFLQHFGIHLFQVILEFCTTSGLYVFNDDDDDDDDELFLWCRWPTKGV